MAGIKPESLPIIKELFEKLYNAYRWTSAHPAIDFPSEHKNLIAPMVEETCDRLEELGVFRPFSMCIFAYGTDWKIQYQMIAGKFGGLT